MTAAEREQTGSQVLAKAVFTATLESLVQIRAFVETWATEIGLGEEPTYRIKLAVSEACANAVEHNDNDGEITLWAWTRQDRFTIDVWHAGEFKVRRDRDRLHRGLGLPLMVACSDEVVFARLPDGGTRVSLSVFFKDRPQPSLD